MKADVSDELDELRRRVELLENALDRQQAINVKLLYRVFSLESKAGIVGWTAADEQLKAEIANERHHRRHTRS